MAEQRGIPRPMWFKRNMSDLNLSRIKHAKIKTELLFVVREKATLACADNSNEGNLFGIIC